MQDDSSSSLEENVYIFNCSYEKICIFLHLWCRLILFVCYLLTLLLTEYVYLTTT